MKYQNTHKVGIMRPAIVPRWLLTARHCSQVHAALKFMHTLKKINFRLNIYCVVAQNINNLYPAICAFLMHELGSYFNLFRVWFLARIFRYCMFSQCSVLVKNVQC